MIDCSDCFRLAIVVHQRDCLLQLVGFEFGATPHLQFFGPFRGLLIEHNLLNLMKSRANTSCFQTEILTHHLILTLSKYLIMAVKWMIRQSIRLLFYGALVSSPITLFPGLVSLIAGGLMQQFHTDRVNHGIQAMISEIESFTWMEEHKDPAWRPFSGKLDTDTAPFYVPRLHSNNWLAKLGLILPRTHYLDNPETADMDLGVDKMLSFDAILRDVSCIGNANEYWVYVSTTLTPDSYSEGSSWDTAFRKLMEHHERYPKPAGMQFAYADCAKSPFLCNVWQIDSPVLMHFKVEVESDLGPDIDPSAYDAIPEFLSQVSVRMIDLGLQESSSPVSPGTFPTEFEQMKSLTSKPGAYTLFEIFDEQTRELERFNNHFTALCNREGSLLDYLTEAENWTAKWLAKPLGLGTTLEIFSSVVFTLSVGISGVLGRIVLLIEGTVSAMLGRPDEFEQLAARLDSVDV